MGFIPHGCQKGHHLNAFKIEKNLQKQNFLLLHSRTALKQSHRTQRSFPEAGSASQEVTIEKTIESRKKWKLQA